jgi:hypothetical protein
LCGFTASGEFNIKHSGKGQAVFDVDSTLESKAFQEKVENIVQDFNVASGSNDMVKLNGIERANNLYKVKVSFRRIDKVHPRGDIFLYKADALKVKQSEELDRLQRWERGDVNCTSYVFYNQLRGLVRIKKPRENGPTVVIKPKSVSGEQVSVKSFAENVAVKNDIVSFQLLDTLGVQKIQITLPGKITYYGGNVTLMDKDTFEITPTTVQAEITRNSADTYESIVTNEEIKIFIGYVAFQKTISPLAVTAIVIGCVTVAGLIAYALVYFYNRGKKLQLREEIEKELGDGRESSKGE